MRIMDVRNQPLAKIAKMERQYPETHYRWVEHACPNPVTDLDIRQFRERMDKEGAVVIFIFARNLTAYIPIKAETVPMTERKEALRRFPPAEAQKLGRR